MSFVVQSDLVIDAPPQRVFDRMADFGSWPAWMPRSFVPVLRDGAPSPLRLGDKFRVRVGGAPIATMLRVSRLDRPREIAWKGGVPGLFWAEHRFVFEPEGDRRTRVRSIETWHGLVARLAKKLVTATALRIGSEQLDGLAKGSALGGKAS